jgi:hypothetical protein
MKIYVVLYDNNYPGEWGSNNSIVSVVMEKPTEDQINRLRNLRKHIDANSDDKWRYIVQELEVYTRLPKHYGSGEYMLLQPWIRDAEHIKGDELFDVDLGAMVYNGKKWV